MQAGSLDIAQYLPTIQVFGQIALISAAIFAGYQFILHRRDRNEHNALEVLTRLTSTEFRQAYAHVWQLPLNATTQDVKEAGPEMESAIDCVAMTFEMIGVMVHQRMVPLDTVDQVIGGFLRESWRRTHTYLEEQRQRNGNRRIAEWYQWLAEHLAHDERRSVGAYNAFKAWKP